MSLLLLCFLFFFLLFFGTPIRAEPNPSQSQQTGLHLELNSASQLPSWRTAFIDLESGVRDEPNSGTEEENTIAQTVFRSIGALVSALRGKKKKRDRKKSTSVPADLSEWPCGEEDFVVANSNTGRSPAVIKKRKNDKVPCVVSPGLQNLRVQQNIKRKEYF